MSFKRYGEKALYMVQFFNPLYYYLLTNVGKHYMVIYDVSITKID
jgi:hypothetical protein